MYIKYGAKRDRFIFFFQGGGWAGKLSKEDTYQDYFERSTTMYGSSKDLPKEMFFPGLFINDYNKNPYFYDYTFIHLNYCDGSGHQGYREEPLIINNKKIWIRGYNNTMTAFNYIINEMNMKKGSEILITGTSAGGLATYMWVDKLS